MAYIDKITDNLEAAARAYEVSSETHEALRAKTLIPLLGPFAVGKTTVMERVSSIDDEFHRVRSFTTRSKRKGESEAIYDFLPHDVATLSKIMAQTATRELVQFMVHPTTKNVYGSHLDDYGTQEYVMLDVVPKALPALEALPFKKIKKIEVVVPPAEWTNRMEERLRHGDPLDIQKRLQEGIHNLEWAFDQGDTVSWLNNGGRSVEASAIELAAIAREQSDSDKAARRIGDDLWTTLKKLEDDIIV